MKIAEIVAHPLFVPAAQPVWTAPERMAGDSVVLVEIRNGMVHLNDRPGFGLEIDWNFASSVRIVLQRSPPI